MRLCVKPCVAGILVVLPLFLAGCGSRETVVPPSQALRVSVSDVAWVAYQDGDGSWQPLPENAAVQPMQRSSTAQSSLPQITRLRPYAPLRPYTTSRMAQTPWPRGATPHLESLQEKDYTLRITNAEGRYGLAYVCLDSYEGYTYSDLTIKLSTLATDADEVARCYDYEEEPTYTLSGTVRGLGNDYGVIDASINSLLFGPPVIVYTGNETYSFELEQDIYDVIATRYSENDTAPNRIIIQNDITLEADKTLDLDFEDEVAFTPDTYTATITDVADGLTPSGGVAFASKNFTIASLGGVAEGTTFDYAAIPAEHLGNDAFVYAYASGSTGLDSNVSVTREPLPPADFSLSLPEPLSGTSVTVQSASTPTLPTATWDSYPGERITYDIYYSQYSGIGAAPSAGVYIDQDWLETTTPLSYTLPDLSTVSGWNSTWNMRREEETSWFIGASLERNVTTESTDYISVYNSGEFQ